jgi:hypothetical protein
MALGWFDHRNAARAATRQEKPTFLGVRAVIGQRTGSGVVSGVGRASYFDLVIAVGADEVSGVVKVTHHTGTLGSSRTVWPDRPTRQIEVPPRGEPMPADVDPAWEVGVLATGCGLHPGYDDVRRTKHSRGGRSARTRKPAISGEDIRRYSARKRSAKSAD